MYNVHHRRPHDKEDLRGDGGDGKHREGGRGEAQGGRPRGPPPLAQDRGGGRRRPRLDPRLHRRRRGLPARPAGYDGPRPAQAPVLRDKLESVNREIESLEKQKKELSGSRGIHVTRSGGFRASGDLSHVETRLTSCQREKGQLQRQVEQMEEDARKAEALPEWLR
jgi:hypothetical protein